MKTHSAIKLSIMSILAAGLMTPSSHAGILQDFDGTSDQVYVEVVKPEVGNFDADPDLEGKFTNSGFKPVFRIKVKRGTALQDLNTSPVLKGSISASRAENSAPFVLLTVVLQTDITGKSIFEPVEEFKVNPLKAERFEFDLRKAKTKSIPSIQEALRSYQEGTGKFFNIVLIQQSPKGTNSVVIYDDIELAPAP